MKRIVVTGLLLVLAAAAGAAELTPEDTVKEYLSALQSGKFDAAYPLVSRGMTRGKNRDEWVKEQQWVMQVSEAKILDFHVYPGKTQGDKAQVPNLLSSQDKFLNQLGVDEHELYTLVREDGHWKIDQQEIVEPSHLGDWFPGEGGKKKAE